MVHFSIVKNFWAAFIGLIGTVLIFFFVLPSRINPEGHIYLICEQVDEKEKRKQKNINSGVILEFHY